MEETYYLRRLEDLLVTVCAEEEMLPVLWGRGLCRGNLALDLIHLVRFEHEPDKGDTWLGMTAHVGCE